MAYTSPLPDNVVKVLRSYLKKQNRTHRKNAKNIITMSWEHF